MFKQKISFVYWICARLNKPMDYSKAIKIAEKFTVVELERLFVLVSR